MIDNQVAIESSANREHGNVSNVQTTKVAGTSYLDVPTTSAFRPSIDTTYSEFSLLSAQSVDANQLLLEDAANTDIDGTRGRLRTLWIRQKGVFYVLISQLFGSCMSLSARVLESPGSHGKGMHPFQILFARMVITMGCSIGYMRYTRTPGFPLGPKDVRPLLIVRGLGGFFGVCGLYYSLVYLPLSEAVVIGFLAPMVANYAYSFIQPLERFTRTQQIGGFVSLLGVVFIAQPVSLFSSSPSPAAAGSAAGEAGPALNSTGLDNAPNGRISEPLEPTASQRLLAIALAMMGVLGSAIAITTIRYIGRRAHPLIVTNYFATWCTIVSVFAFIVIPGVSFKLPENITEWGLLIFLGINGFTMQVLLTVGLAYSSSSNTAKESKVNNNNLDPESASSSVNSQASRQPLNNFTSTATTSTKSPAGSSAGSRATTMLYTPMLFALLFDKLIWGISPNIWSWAGSGLILGSVIWVAVTKDKSSDTNHSSGGGGGNDISNNHEGDDDIDRTRRTSRRRNMTGTRTEEMPIPLQRRAFDNDNNNEDVDMTMGTNHSRRHATNSTTSTSTSASALAARTTTTTTTSISTVDPAIISHPPTTTTAFQPDESSETKMSIHSDSHSDFFQSNYSDDDLDDLESAGNNGYDEMERRGLLKNRR